MFKEIIEIWNRGGLIKQSNQTTLRMIELTKKMYVDAMGALKSDIKVCPVDLYKYDRVVNEMQIDVRRKVLEHLSISGRRDVSAGLILLLAVNDIERIGDYCKNICDLVAIHPRALKKNQYLEMVSGIDKLLEENFDLLRGALKEASKEKAAKAVENFERAKKLSTKLIQLLLEDKKLGRKELVLYSLLSRHLKRIGAHQKNAATTVINPFERIGYQNRGPGDKAEK
jgi:phosphate uptake regulator